MRKIVAFSIIALSLGGCGDLVNIQSGEVGKQLTKNGYEEQIRNPGQTRLDWCSTNECNYLVRLDISLGSNGFEVDSIYLPTSNVDITNIRVGVQYRVRQNQASQNRIFNEVKPSSNKDNKREFYISNEAVWETYGKRIVPAVVVDALKDLTVDQAINVGSELSQVVKSQVDKRMAGSPIEITQLDIQNTDVPEMVMAAKRALFSIEDNKTRRIKELESSVATERQRQTFQQLRAKNDLEIANMLGIPVAQYMCLKISERLADSADEKGMTVVANADCGLSSEARNRILPLNTNRPAPTP